MVGAPSGIYFFYGEPLFRIWRFTGYFDTLINVDTVGVPGTSHAISLTNAFRDDDPHLHLDPALALRIATEKDDGTFTVP